MRTARRVIVALAVLGLLGAGVALWVLSDPAPLLARALPAVERATGRTLTVGGVSVTRGSVTLRDVVLTGTDADEAPQRIRAKSVVATLSFWALLRGRVEVASVAITDADALFETDAQGALRMGFTAAKRPEAAVATEPAPAQGGGGARAAIGALTADDVTLTLRNRRTGLEEVVALRRLALRLPPGGAATLAVQGTARGVALTVAATGGPAEAIGRADYPLKIAVQAGADRVAFDGTVGPSVSGAVDVAVPDPAVVSPLLGRIGLPPVSVSGHVEGTPEKAAFDLAGAAYGSKVTAKGTLTLAPRPDLVATVVADRLDPAAWARPVRAPAPSPAPASVPAASVPGPAAPAAGALAGPGAAVAARPGPDARQLGALDADLTVSVGVIEPGVRDVSGHLVLKDAVLTADPVAATYEGVTARGRAVLDGRGEVPKVAIMVPGMRVPAQALSPWLPVLRGATGTAEVFADLTGAGADARTIEATLGGRLGVAMVDGAVAPGALTPLLSAARLPVAVPSGLTEVKCLAVRVDFSGGAGRVEPVVLDGVFLRVTGGGTVDLRERTLSLRLRPFLRAGGFGVTVPVTVSGPVGAPRVAADLSAGPGGGLVLGGLAGGMKGVLGGVLKEVAGPAGPDPCPAALRAARLEGPPVPEAAAPAGDQPGAGGKAPKLDPGDLLRGLLR